MQGPYRQPLPLYINNVNYTININTSSSDSVLSEGLAQYIQETVILAKQEKFKKGALIIDLTDQSSTLVYVMGVCNLAGGSPGYLVSTPLVSDRQ